MTVVSSLRHFYLIALLNSGQIFLTRSQDFLHSHGVSTNPSSYDYKSVYGSVHLHYVPTLHILKG